MRDHVVRDFSYASARSGSLLAGIGIALVVETVALHLWLYARHPLLAWGLTVASLGTLAWLVADYVAMGRGVVRVDADAVRVAIGRRVDATVERQAIASVVRPGWKDIPESGMPAAADYLNLTKPAEPNVLITLVAPKRLRLAGGISRNARRLGLHLDDADGFVATLGEAAPTR